MVTLINSISRDFPSKSTNRIQVFHLFAMLWRQPKEAQKISWFTDIWINSHMELDGLIDLVQLNQRSKVTSCMEEVPQMMVMHHSLACLQSRHATIKEFQPQESALFSRLKKSLVVPTLLLFLRLPSHQLVYQMHASAWTQVLLTTSSSGSPVL